MQALEFQPIIKRYRWGGSKLGTLLDKPIGEHADCAESWEISDYGDDHSVVIDGPYRGWTLRRLIEERGDELFGPSAHESRFPLLVKFLDARDRLSVQVHPNDERAAQFGPHERGKTEAWIIVSAEQGSKLYTGLKSGVDRRRLEKAIADGSIEECLHSFPVSAGDAVHVPAGTVHAIGEGIVLAEIQQTSNLTFRLFDWNRVDADGRPRTLHVEEALASTDFERGPVERVPPRIVRSSDTRLEELVSDRYFTIRRHVADTPVVIDPEGRFRILMLLSGEAALTCGDQQRSFALGTTLLLPASAEPARIVPREKGVEIQMLEVFVP